VELGYFCKLSDYLLRQLAAVAIEMNLSFRQSCARLFYALNHLWIEEWLAGEHGDEGFGRRVELGGIPQNLGIKLIGHSAVLFDLVIDTEDATGITVICGLNLKNF
jgi:hypothetical protein